jgi:hypothetical protein
MIQQPTGLEALRGEIARALGTDSNSSFADCGRALSALRPAALLIDDAQRLIKPVMGGIEDFDRVIAMARQHSAECAWFFAVDDVVWRFFERARGVRPLFDDVIELRPFSEEAIAQLLRTRASQAGIEPCFDHLLEQLPADADQVDRADALARTRGGYDRLLWDYSAGNPGVALHIWRKSMGIDAGHRVHVKVFQAPRTEDLEKLPDSAVFVLRAVIQLDPAREADIAQATMLQPGEVENALRYGLARGYLERRDLGYRVTWAWFRAITRFLQRRHLLSTLR